MKPEDVMHSVGNAFGKLKNSVKSGDARSRRPSADPDDDYDDAYDDYGDGGAEEDEDLYEDEDAASRDADLYEDPDGGYDDGYIDEEPDDGYVDEDPEDGSYEQSDDGSDTYDRDYDEAFAAREERYRARHREALLRRQRQLRQHILIAAAVVAVLVIILVITARSGRSGNTTAADSSSQSAESAALSGTAGVLSGTVSGTASGTESTASDASESNSLYSSVSSYTSYEQDKMPAVALTFDDGPRTGNTDSILDVLEQYNAHATFFVLGENCEKNTDTLKRAVSLGCEIGSHTWDHEQLTKLSADERQQEYSKAADAIEEYAGVSPTVFRPPYGSDNSEIKEELDIPIILWELDTLDWKTKSADSTYNTIDQELREGDIVLMHDIQGSTVEAIPRVVPMLVNKGYKLLTVTELYDYYGEDLKLHMNHAYSGPRDSTSSTDSTASGEDSSSSSN